MTTSRASTLLVLSSLTWSAGACSDAAQKSSDTPGSGGASASAGKGGGAMQGAGASGKGGAGTTGGSAGAGAGMPATMMSGGAGGAVSAGGSSTAGGLGGTSSGGAAGSISPTGGVPATGGAGAASGGGGMPMSVGGAAGAGPMGGAGMTGGGGQSAGMSGAAGSAAGAGGKAGSSGAAGKGGSAGAGGAGGGVLGATPPMGWNSWNTFTSQVSESLIKQVADAMVSNGMQAAGYQYVNIDDTWQASARDSNNKITANTSRFPGGIKALADYVHNKGLKLGVYSDRGDQTCAGYPGSYGHETDDANTYAAWGVDYLKYDNCYVHSGRDTNQGMQEDYTKMRNALDASGRPILFSICAWWFYSWMPSVGHIWRTTTDIQATWSTDDHSILSLTDKNGGDKGRYSDAAYDAPGIAQYAGPGHFNDPDMLEVGNGSLTTDENKAHMSLWAMMAAPLIAGNDVRSMSTTIKDILTNADVIAVDQDPLGKQGKPISSSTTLEVWSKQLTGTNTYAVLLLNRTGSASAISVTWASLGLSGAATVRDLWSHQDLGSMASGYAPTVPSHGVVMLKVVGQ